MKLAFAYVLSFLLATRAGAVCFCPRGCVTTYDDSGCDFFDRTLCNDLEAAAECNAANAELTDAVNSIGRNGDLFLTGALFNGSIDPAAASFLRTQLTLAMENDKPVADCEAGLTTEILVKNTQSHCYSPELYVQCVALRDGVSAWSGGIRGKLNATAFRADVPRDVSLDFVSAIGARADANTARIRCASHEEGIEQINGSRGPIASIAAVAASAFCAWGALL